MRFFAKIAAGMTALSPSPVDGAEFYWAGSYEFSAVKFVRGDVSHSTLGSGLLDLNAAVESLLPDWGNGGSLFGQVLGRHGLNANELLGDLQTFSNLDAGRFVHVEELWYEHNWRDGAWRLKVGQIDANSEFAFVEAAGEFTQSSAGYSPTIGFPTYPEASLGVCACARTSHNVRVGLGVFGDTMREPLRASRRDPYWIVEASVPLEVLGSPAPGRIAMGAWRETATLDRFDEGSANGSSGWYALGECQVWRAHPDHAESTAGVTAFAQWGAADEEVSAIRTHQAFGVVCVGLFPARKSDLFGFYWTRVVTSRTASAGFTADETATEIFYAVVINDHMQVKPGAQWIQHPGGDAARPSATVLSLRTELSF